MLATLASRIEPIGKCIVLLCSQNSCDLLSYCCIAVENLSKNRTRIVFQTKGVINDDERQTNGDKNGRNPKRRIRIRNEAKERRLAISTAISRTSTFRPGIQRIAQGG